jgi:hypothetical protein
MKSSYLKKFDNIQTSQVRSVNKNLDEYASKLLDKYVQLIPHLNALHDYYTKVSEEIEEITDAIIKANEKNMKSYL